MAGRNLRRHSLLQRVGRVLVAAGLLVLAFVAYQLWGTGLYTDHAQSQLRHRLSDQLGLAIPQSVAPTRSTHSRLPPVAAALAAQTAEPGVGSPIGYLSIPAIQLNDVLLEGVSAAQLEQGPGHYPGTPLPGQPGNVAIAGHRTTYAAPFYNLNELQPGDLIFVLTAQGLFRYRVSGTQVVLPTDVSVLDTTGTTSTLTLTTCNPRYSAAQRLVVVATFDPRRTTGSAASKPKSLIASHVRHGSASTGALASGGTGNAVLAVVWAVVTAALAAVAIWAWHRLGSRARWITVFPGVPLIAFTLLLCFEHASLALPPSF